MKELLRARLPGKEVATILEELNVQVLVAIHIEGMLSLQPGWLAGSQEGNAMFRVIAAELLVEAAEALR